MATLLFTNAYAVNTSVTPASKELSAPAFVYTTLGPVAVSDGSSGPSFSGVDVPVALTIGSEVYWGWISRPIKSGGQIKGFYFWTDPDFTTRELSIADGNADADGSADNLGFLLVVDQAHFDSVYTADPTNPTVRTSSDRGSDQPDSSYIFGPGGHGTELARGHQHSPVSGQ